MISLVLCGGAVVVLVCALLKSISRQTRVLVCWSAAAICLCVCAVLFFACSDGLSIDAAQVVPAVVGLTLLAALTVGLELLSPFRRSRAKQPAERDAEAEERALNIVLALTGSALSVFAAVGELADNPLLTGLSIVVSSAISIRQTWLFLRLSGKRRDDENRAAYKRSALMKRLKTRKSRL
ncbi:MAG: hypothetical protein KIG62_02965 [Oscillospiraceae bacterium]|nr:hypothetical protein [Oscillospiraceae bacterium]